MIHSLHMLGEFDTRNKNLYICKHKKGKKWKRKTNNKGEGKKKEKNSAPCEDRTHDLQMPNVWLWDWRAAYCANEALPVNKAAKELNKHS